MPQIYQRTLFKLASREPPRTTLPPGSLYRAEKILIYFNQNYHKLYFLPDLVVIILFVLKKVLYIKQNEHLNIYAQINLLTINYIVI